MNEIDILFMKMSFIISTIKGFVALQRKGIKFTDEQKEIIRKHIEEV